jgi:hypothetical protein
LPRFTHGDLLIAITARLEGTGAVASLDPSLTEIDDAPTELRVWNRRSAPPRIGLNVNGVTILVEGHDRPAFSDGQLARLDYRSWNEGRARIARTRAHVEIYEVQAVTGADLDHNHDRAAAVTLVAEALTGLADPVAIVWQASRRAMPVEELAPLVAELAAGQAPVPLWLGCLGRPEGARGASTLGLYPLLGAEIEVASPVLSREKATRVAMDMVVEIFRSGEPPAHGSQLGYDKDLDFNVRYRMDDLPGAVPVVVLTQVAQPVEIDMAAAAARVA